MTEKKPKKCRRCTKYTRTDIRCPDGKYICYECFRNERKIRDKIKS